MRISKIIFIFLILFAAVQFCPGQEKPIAQLIDKELESIGPDHLRGRVIDFLQKIHDDPGSKGVAIIYSEENLSSGSLYYFNEIYGRTVYHKFPLDRLTIIRARKPGNESFEFWKVSAGAADPPLAGKPWSYELPGFTKAFKLGTTFREDGFPLAYELCAGFLRANPDLRGNIAVYYRSRKEAKKEGNSWLKILTGEYKIPRDRLKVFYGKAKRFGGGTQTYSDVEFWLVPKKKK